MQNITKLNFELISPIRKTNVYLTYNILQSAQNKYGDARNPEPES